MSGSVTAQILSTLLVPLITRIYSPEDFGKNWYISGVYIKILIPWIFLVFLSLPISALYMIFDKQGVWFYVILLAAGISTPIYYVLTLYDDPTFKRTLSAFLINIKNKI